MSEEYIIVTRRRPKTPTWLRPYQQALKEASRVAAEETKHLKGQRRVEAMNKIIAERVKEAKSREG